MKSALNKLASMYVYMSKLKGKQASS